MYFIGCVSVSGLRKPGFDGLLKFYFFNQSGQLTAAAFFTFNCHMPRFIYFPANSLSRKIPGYSTQISRDGREIHYDDRPFESYLLQNRIGFSDPSALLLNKCSQ
jgi:hypothetical protein